MMDHHHHHAHHHQIPVSIPPVSVHDISRLQQHQIFHNPANIVHEAGTGNNNIHSNNSNNVNVSQNGNGDDGKALVEKSKKGESGEKIVRYRECQKNHAANIGSHALDGCGEFMASGLEGTAEALKCQACGCHRNFHRQEVEGEGGLDGWYSGPAGRSRVDKKRLLPGGGNVGVSLFSSPSPPHAAAAAAVNASGPQMLMALSSACTLGDPELHEGFVGRGVGSSSSAMKKRFRTKFSQDQKEKMQAFADQLGWRIQKHDEAAVHQFCNEVGVRRHVLKVWMHNNKNTLGKKL